MTAGYGDQLISVQPNQLNFIFELDKPSYCNLKLKNNIEQHVVFNVKTTSPKKYFVRPNTGVVMPRDSCVIRDKFLLQSTIVPPNIDVDDLPAVTFNKESGKKIKEWKLKVIYESPSAQENSGGLDNFTSQKPDSNSAMQHLKDERDAAAGTELNLLKRERKRRNNSSFSFVFASFVGLIGIMVGFLLNLSLASPSTE